MKKSVLLLFFMLLAFGGFAQRQISGVISLSDTGEPEPGVNVIVTGTTTGTITDFDGKYSLLVPQGKSVTISYLGYKSQTVTPKADVLDVVLEVEAEELEEVVAVGYGTMKKSDVTGAITSIAADQLKKTPASGVDQALQGKAAGVTVNANSGQPGQAAEVRIRGIGTVNDASPIYVVDGIITSDISFLSPNDIETTEVLKDASSTAIYGSRAANGVILITTKKGEKDRKAKISFNAYGGFQNCWKRLSLMKRDDFASAIVYMRNDATEVAEYEKGFLSWLNTYRLGGPYFPSTLDYSEIETDWQNEVFRANAPIMDYYLSVDGATDKANYSISADYFNQAGTIKGSDYDRLTLRANSAFQARSWLKIGENISFMTSRAHNAMNNNASPGASILSAALAMAPWDPTHYPDGSFNKSGENLSGRIAASSNFKNVTNPFTMIEKMHPEYTSERFVGDIFVDINPVKGLNIRSTVSLDLANNIEKNFTEEYEYSSYDKNSPNYLAIRKYKYSTIRNENIATYAREIKKHNFSVMAGFTIEEYNAYIATSTGKAILNPIKSNWYINQTTEEQTTTDEVDRKRMVSALARAFYSYDNRYLITVNFRADGSSKFKKNPWGFFPSVALAWRLSEERFMKKYTKMDYFKVRAGWGQVGNDKIPSNGSVTNVVSGDKTFTGYILGKEQLNVNGAAVLSLANEDIKWETTEQWNAGVDFSFWNGMLGGTVDGYIRDTKDMLMYVTAPAQVGNRFAAQANVGTVRNSGIEISLDHRNSAGDFNYSIGGNISFVKNILTGLNGGSPVRDPNGYWICDEGLPLYTFWGYEYEGVYKTDEEAKAHLPKSTNPVSAGDSKYKDQNGDGKIDDADKVNLGNPFPWLTYGLNFGFDVKGVDFQMFFQGVFGNHLYNAVRERTEGTGTNCTLSTSMTDVWTKENVNGTIPNPYGNSLNSAPSSRFVEDGQYLRLKNVQIGYTLPKKITMKAHISRLRFYVSASNLFTLTKYTGYDPEVNGGVDFGNYPQATTFQFGLNLDF